jgi:hypothetical protein
VAQFAQRRQHLLTWRLPRCPPCAQSRSRWAAAQTLLCQSPRGRKLSVPIRLFPFVSPRNMCQSVLAGLGRVERPWRVLTRLRPHPIRLAAQHARACSLTLTLGLWTLSLSRFLSFSPPCPPFALATNTHERTLPLYSFVCLHGSL